MREESVADKIWSSVLIALPVIACILGLLPIMPMYSKEAAGFVACNLLSPPEGNIMTNLCPLLVILFAYTVILTVCYFRSQALGTIKAIFIFSIVCLVISALALLPHNTVQPMPYSLIILVWAVMGVVSFIRMQLEIKRYDFD